MDLRDHIRLDVDRVAALLATLDAPSLSLPVPACPGWGIADVVGHLGGVHRMVIRAIDEGRGSHSGEHVRSDLLADPVRLAAWLRDGAAALAERLDGDPSTPAWSFAPGKGTVGFWRDRQALETLIHRVDVEQALGLPSVIDPALADAGVTEVIELLVPLRVREGDVVLPRARVVLHVADTRSSWRLGSNDDPTPDEVPAEVTFPTSADLLLTLWKRSPLPRTLEPAALRLLELPLTP